MMRRVWRIERPLSAVVFDLIFKMFIGMKHSKLSVGPDEVWASWREEGVIAEKSRSGSTLPSIPTPAPSSGVVKLNCTIYAYIILSRTWPNVLK